MIEMILSIIGTLAIYYMIKEMYGRTKKIWFLPILLCPILIVVFLMSMKIPYTSYRSGAVFLQWLLEPVTVAFAIPLYRQRKLVKRYLPELCIVGLVAATAAIATTMGATYFFGVDRIYTLSLAPRSITTPIAMNVSSMLGGNATITAVFVILTGVIGMLMTVALVRLLKIRNPMLKGLLFGFSAHGTGTARAYEDSERTGVMASVAMIFMGVITALIAPLVVPLLLACF